MPTRKKRFTTGRVLATIAVLATVLAPTAVFATHFTDTGASVHKANIEWLETTGVTGGCTATNYCPTDPVTREQMATFMRRLAGQAEGVAPVVNAAQLGGFAANDLVRVAFERSDDVDEPTGGDPLAVLTATMDIPTKGFLIMDGGVQSTRIGTGKVAYGCSIHVDGSEMAGSDSFGYHEVGNGEIEINHRCNTESAVEVNVPRTLDIELVVDGFADDEAALGDATIWAIFVPFDGMGVQAP